MLMLCVCKEGIIEELESGEMLVEGLNKWRKGGLWLIRQQLAVKGISPCFARGEDEASREATDSPATSSANWLIWAGARNPY
jgi:hypothetical protein